MKYIKIKSLSFNILKKKIKTEQLNLKKLKFTNSISPIENPMKIRNLKKIIARFKTAESIIKIQNKWKKIKKKKLEK